MRSAPRSVRVAMVGSPDNQGNATSPVTITVNAITGRRAGPSGRLSAKDGG